MSVLQHYFNSLHVFCLLISLGVGKRRALRLARAWERCAHPLLYYRAWAPVPVAVEKRRRG
ncbi:MAG: hypothetical protein HZB84_09355 [Deltaproteobacteria bacterium]|nr:hypothetical protein [Deltaproteobacteria bacterium]